MFMADLRIVKLPAPLAGSLQHPDYWVWGASPIEGDDGKFHLFASLWPKTLPFNCWVTHSEIWRAESTKPGWTL